MSGVTTGFLTAGSSVGRDAARRAVEQELSKPEYAQAKPSLLARAYLAVAHWLEHVFGAAAAAGPGGLAGVILLLLVIEAIVVIVVVRVRPAARVARRPRRADWLETRRSAADHRAEADRMAAAGRCQDAVRERLRAVIRELEERGIVDLRPGWTATEAAHEAARAVPDLGDELRRGVGLFEEIWYGGRLATEEHDAVLRTLDQRVRTERLPVLAELATAGATGSPVGTWR